jgi:hypothetical protein
MRRLRDLLLLLLLLLLRRLLLLLPPPPNVSHEKIAIDGAAWRGRRPTLYLRATLLDGARDMVTPRRPPRRTIPALCKTPQM